MCVHQPEPPSNLHVLIYFHSVIFIVFHGSDYHRFVCQLPFPLLCLSYSAIVSFQGIFHFIFLYFSSLIVCFSVLFVCVFSSLSHIQHFWDPINCGLQGRSVCGIFQARILEGGAIFFSRGSS